MKGFLVEVYGPKHHPLVTSCLSAAEYGTRAEAIAVANRTFLKPGRAIRAVLVRDSNNVVIFARRVTGSLVVS